MVEGLLSDSLEVFDELTSTGVKAQELRSETSTAFANFCPDVNMVQTFGVDFNIEDLSSTLGDVGDFMVEDGTKIEAEVKSIYDMLTSANEFLANSSSLKGSIAYIVLPISLVCTILVSGTMLASSGFSSFRLQALQTRFIMPLLLVVSIVYWILASVFGLISIITAGM